ncbi:SulP family inorganic anion transporter [Alkalilimnicola sp. S0819]|uniref:SulP family inorganic anion transporter n=1 Tax=Alkalilimnicola sp. S0819 TaxID=2613922 RepID=UPI0012613D73|nr:SulP family inorganic anion transporter [Alkalilimnicola sp. S0819]KAB7627319.1 SulP family inorganic anion transporter [Alkalilimnicola sp. S0819]MPQ16034.1 STAS domain-containing protein [Alkalilimnicola sp. S0819]
MSSQTFKRGSWTLRQQWFSNVRGDLIAGIVVALALIPEAIAFSIIAGVDPKVGLYASFTMAVTIAFAGGRSGMISAATGAMALLMIDLVADHGLEYLFAATILTGVLQIIFGALKLARYMMFIPRTVMLGFVNALAILIFMAQLPHFVGLGMTTYVIVAAGLAILYGLPYITRAVPPGLVAIVLLTVVVVFFDIPVRTVGDMGELPDGMPFFHLPAVPLNWETLQIIFPVALALALVGLLESLLTASILDDLTDTPSRKNTESRGQGIANIVTGCFGGMAGCAMIGQSIINIKSDGRGRLSTLAAGIYLLFFILVLGEWVSLIPMPALVAVMIMVSISTFDWTSIPMLTKLPRSDAFVLIVTVATVVLTHDLAKGVFAGVLLSAVFFARKMVRQIHVRAEDSADGRHRTYHVSGALFFVAVDHFLAGFDYQAGVPKVTLDFSHASLWDSSAIGAVDKVVGKLRRSGADVDVIPPEYEGRELLEKLAAYDKPGRDGAGH